MKPADAGEHRALSRRMENRLLVTRPGAQARLGRLRAGETLRSEVFPRMSIRHRRDNLRCSVVRQPRTAAALRRRADAPPHEPSDLTSQSAAGARGGRPPLRTSLSGSQHADVEAAPGGGCPLPGSFAVQGWGRNSSSSGTVARASVACARRETAPRRRPPGGRPGFSEIPAPALHATALYSLTHIGRSRRRRDPSGSGMNSPDHQPTGNWMLPGFPVRLRLLDSILARPIRSSTRYGADQSPHHRAPSRSTARSQ